MKLFSLHAVRVALAFFAVVSINHNAHATGITADVGLTPPIDRWIFRSQLRYMERDDPTAMGRNMEMYMVPVVLAYGVRPEMTVIVRQPFIRRTMEMPTGDVQDTGRGDLAVIGKYRLLRINHPNYIVGVAPTLGIELPTGDDDIAADTWDILAGIYISGRRGPLGADLNLEYKTTGIEDRDANRPGDEFTATLSLAHQLTLNRQATMSLWPLVELAYTHESNTRANSQKDDNSGEDALLVSPGLKFARQSFMLELLLQLPLEQEQNGNQLERAPGGLFGIRLLF
jgi:hypothetical protein